MPCLPVRACVRAVSAVSCLGAVFTVSGNFIAWHLNRVYRAVLKYGGVLACPCRHISKRNSFRIVNSGFSDRVTPCYIQALSFSEPCAGPRGVDVPCSRYTCFFEFRVGFCDHIVLSCLGRNQFPAPCRVEPCYVRPWAFLVACWVVLCSFFGPCRAVSRYLLGGLSGRVGPCHVTCWGFLVPCWVLARCLPRPC